MSGKSQGILRWMISGNPERVNKVISGRFIKSSSISAKIVTSKAPHNLFAKNCRVFAYCNLKMLPLLN